MVVFEQVVAVDVVIWFVNSTPLEGHAFVQDWESGVVMPGWLDVFLVYAPAAPSGRVQGLVVINVGRSDRDELGR